MVRWPREGELSTYTCEMEGFGYLDLVGSLHGDIRGKNALKSLMFCCRQRLMEAVRQKSRYNQLFMYQIRRIEIYLSFCKH